MTHNPETARLTVGDRERVMTAVGTGNRTFRIAKALGWTTPKARYYLLRLEQAGKVLRHERYTAENDIYWIPA